jgi:HEAT repeat protein
MSPKALRVVLLLAVFAGLLAFASKSGAVQAVIEMIFSGHDLPVPGAPVPATHARLSEHEIEYINSLPPQQQAEELVQAAINHDIGATDMIMQKLESWKADLKRTKKWETLEQTALYSNDLRVRAAAIEVALIAYSVQKDPQWVDRLIDSGEKTHHNRPFDGWVLGMLASRGVESQRIHDKLREWMHDSDQQTRFWAVEGTALIGTDDIIPDLLDVLRNDSSPEVRERGGCSLAKSGMLTRVQRMKAVPGLIEIAADPSEDPTTHSWAFQALREITNEPIANDVNAWKNWYDTHGSERTQQFHQQGQSQVLGNS